MESKRKRRRQTSTRIDPTKPASIVIEKLGGLVAFSEATGFATSTAHYWAVKGYIPGEHHAHILAIARSASKRLKRSDFVEAPAALVTGG